VLRFYAGLRSDLANSSSKLNPLVSAQFELPLEERRSARVPERVFSIADADVVVAPRIWSTYAVRGDLTEPLALAEEASRAKKPFLIWHTGDLDPILPSADWIVFVNAIDRSKRRRGWFVAPRFIEDPLISYGQDFPMAREKGDSPRVGFCGYASSSALKLGYSLLQNLGFRLGYHAGRKMYEPPSFVPATLLRAKVLRALERDARVATDFIVRTRYKTGSAQEFYRNILETDYTVCVRGYGNWSVRLYETLACGRIPVLIDTDCTLPFHDTIDWKHYCVWVPESHASRVGEYVGDFHRSMSAAAFREQQRECRRLWESRLSRKGFLSHLHEYFAGPLLPNLRSGTKLSY
jgi:hypothetical protein